MLSLQSAAAQQAPQVAPPSAPAQHFSPSPQRGAWLHLPPVHTPTVQGSLSVSHSSLEQHSAAQPASGQQREPSAQKA
jgi:hypothetical protein